MLLAIDPGADAGWARFDQGKLRACGLGSPLDFSGIDVLIVERPTIYPGGRQQARPADVITLALRAGEAAGFVCARVAVTPEYVEPRTWKGSVSKSVCHDRIRSKLSEDELRVLAVGAGPISPSKRHNVLDAIGIGLWRCGR